MRMRICYLDCHEAGLCCYLVIHTENLLRPLQLFYFHLWPIYWLSIVPFHCALVNILRITWLKRIRIRNIQDFDAFMLTAKIMLLK
jgi:hypothetical protein